MGTYNISVDELEKTLEKFLQLQEGQVFATTLAVAWNRLAKKNGWTDGLRAVLRR